MLPSRVPSGLLFALATIQLSLMGCGSDASSEPAAVTTESHAVNSGAVNDAAPVNDAAAVQVGEAEQWPTEEEVKAAILKVEYGINASETNKSIWKVKDFRHEVKSIKFAQKTTQKQMTYGADAITVYPVKVLYTQITDYDGKASSNVETGDDGVWFLYRDSFGEWTGKYGSE